MDVARAGIAEAADLTETDEAIAARARVDRQAFAELYLRHRDAVVGYLRARVLSDDDALELTAITFERALVALDRYRPRGAGFRAWLLRIARNAAVDEARRRARRDRRWFDLRRSGTSTTIAELEIADPSPGPDHSAIRAEEQRRLRRALSALPEAHRDSLGLRFGAGLTAREIGVVIGKREAAVQKLIERAVDRLREDVA
jgi:RNA polymerase sigma-70 factor (ECF subfamily)